VHIQHDGKESHMSETPTTSQDPGAMTWTLRDATTWTAEGDLFHYQIHTEDQPLGHGFVSVFAEIPATRWDPADLDDVDESDTMPLADAFAWAHDHNHDNPDPRI
jgi:hypothetical protein